MVETQLQHAQAGEITPAISDTVVRNRRLQRPLRGTVRRWLVMGVSVG